MKNHLLAAMLVFSLAGAAQASPTPHTFDAPPVEVHHSVTPDTGGIRPMGVVEGGARRPGRRDRGTLFNTGGMRANLGYGVRRAQQRVDEAQQESEEASQQPAGESDYVASGERRVDSHDLELQEDAFEEARAAYRRGDMTALELEERLRFLDSYEGIESLRREEAEQREQRLAQAQQELEEAQAELESRQAEAEAQEVVETAEEAATEVVEAAETAAEEAVNETEEPAEESSEGSEPDEPEGGEMAAHTAPPSTVVSDHHQDGLWSPFNDFELTDPGNLPGRSSDWPSDGLDILIHLHDLGVGWTLIDRFLEAGGTVDMLVVEISDQGRYSPDLKAIKIPPNKYTNGRLSNSRTFTTTLAHELWHAYYHQVVTQGYDPDTQQVFDDAVDWLLEQDLQKKDGNTKLPPVNASEITSWGMDDFEETDFMDEYVGALLNDLVLQHLSIQARMEMAIEEGMSEEQAHRQAQGKWNRAVNTIKNSKYEAYEDADSGDYFVDANPPGELVDHMVNLFNLGF